MKTCSKCGIEKELSEFSKDKTRKNGLQSQCKACIKEYQQANKDIISERVKEYNEANKDVIRERKKKYHEANKDVISEKQKQYNEANKNIISERRKKYREANKDVIRERKKQHYEANKDIISEKRKITRKQKTKYNMCSDRLGIYETIREDSDGYMEVICAYCGAWTYPTKGQVNDRLLACENPNETGEMRIYCNNSDTGQGCREACPTYRTSLYPKDFKPATSREVIPLVRHMVFKRDNYTCQHCSKTIQTTQIHAHHIEGVAHYPMLQHDIDNIITLCKKCHKALHKQNGCEYKDYKCA